MAILFNIVLRRGVVQDGVPGFRQSTPALYGPQVSQEALNGLHPSQVHQIQLPRYNTRKACLRKHVDCENGMTLGTQFIAMVRNHFSFSDYPFRGV